MARERRVPLLWRPISPAAAECLPTLPVLLEGLALTAGLGKPQKPCALLLPEARAAEAPSSAELHFPSSHGCACV